MKETTGEAKAKKGFGAKFKGITFVDVLIALALVLLAAIIINIFLPQSLLHLWRGESEKEIQYTVEFLCVDKELIDKINEGDNVIDSTSKYTLGTVITSDYTAQYTELKYNEQENSGFLSPFEGKYNVLVTVKVSAEYTEGEGYSVGDRRIAVGEKLSLRFPHFAGEGYCISLSEGQ